MMFSKLLQLIKGNMKSILFILLLFSSIPINACMCHPLTLEENIERSNFIFSCKVISQDGYHNTIIVTNVWKGELKDTVELFLGTTSCHKRNLEISKNYLIFLENPNVGIYNCSRTVELKFSQDIDKLNEIFKNKRPKSIDCLTENESLFIKNVFVNSKLDTLKNLNDSCTFFVSRLYNSNNSDYEIISVLEFIKLDHFGSIPLIMELDSKNENMTYYAFAYWSLDYIKSKKIQRKLKRKIRNTSCNKR